MRLAHPATPVKSGFVAICGAHQDFVLSVEKSARAELGEVASATHYQRMTTRLWASVLALFASAGLVASCSIDRERKMYPGGGAPGGTVGLGGSVEGEPSGGGGGADLGPGPDDDPPPNLDLGGASSLIDMAPPVIATDLAPAASRDFGPEFLDLF